MPRVAPPYNSSLWRWTAQQFAAAAYGLYLACGGGVLQALRRRAFCGRAAAVALALALAHLTLLGLWLHRGEASGHPVAPAMWWSMGLLGSVACGAAAASKSGTLAFWETHALTFVTTFGLWMTLRAPTHLQGPWAMGHGERLFGPLWDRLLGLYAPLSFLSAVVGASFVLAARGLGPVRGSDGVGHTLAWRLAWRHLAGRGRMGLSSTAWVAVLGIGLGVAALLATTAVMSGYQEDIRGRILGTNAHLVVQKYGVDFTGYEAVIREAQACDGVLAAAPFAFNEAMLAGPAQGCGVLLKGVAAAPAAKVTDLGRNLCVEVTGVGAAARCRLAPAAEADAGAARLQQALAVRVGPPPLLVGLSLYQRLGLPLGAQVRLMTPVGMAGRGGNAPRRASFVLAGVFSSGMHEFDSRLTYTSLVASQHLLGLGDAVSGVEMRLRDPYQVEAVGRLVLQKIGRYPYRTLDWRQLNAGIFTALVLQKVVMFLVLAFIVVVASFNVASTLFMAVAQKREQVQVLKAMGCKDGVILQTFLLEGWCTGLLGCVAGLLLGSGATCLLGRLHVALAADVYMVDALRVRLQPSEVALVMLCTLVICHLAALVPALGAAKSRGAINAP